MPIAGPLNECLLSVCTTKEISSAFRYFESGPEVIRLVVIIYTRFLLLFLNVGELLHEHGTDFSFETVGYR